MNPTDYPQIEATGAPATNNIHIPLGLLGLAVAFFFGSELRTANKEADIMKWQLSNLDNQAMNLKNAKDQLMGSLVQRDEAVKQIQGQYMNLFGDLIDLGKDDKDAKAIAERWGIKRQEPPAAPAPEKK